MPFPSETPFLPARARRLHAGLAGVLLVGACVSCRSYPDRTDDALDDFRNGDFDGAIAAYTDPDTTGSEFLSGAEAGMVALAAGRWDSAVEELTSAAELVEEIEGRALISAQELGEALLMVTVNERATTYEGEGYERVSIHAGLAMGYLALGRFESARVEVRRANALLETEEELYEKRYAAGGLGHFMSAVTYEIEGLSDEAYIDYRRMVEKDVGTQLAGKALVRLARRLGRDFEASLWEERFGPPAQLPRDAASIVVVAGVGLGPFKREEALALPTFESYFKMSVPKYEERPQPVNRLRLQVAGYGTGVRTTVVEDVSQVARENLDDRIGWLIARSAIRATFKYQIADQLSDAWQGWGWLLGMIMIELTERADLRCWHTLPDTWQVGRLFVPAGSHGLALSAEGGDRVELGEFELAPGETMFVFARTVDRRLWAYAVGGLRVGVDALVRAGDASDSLVP